MAYNFGTAEYGSCFSASQSIDTDPLRGKALDQVAAFDASSWHSLPLVTTLRGEQLKGSDDTVIDTRDAFGHVNGKQILASPAIVDQVIAHACNINAKVSDLRTAIRAIEDTFFGGTLSPFLIANQAIDFHKQDGVTEIEESIQALKVERKLNDALYEDELAGKVQISRAPAFIGCVSNFTNFLDLCRKIFRNVELGVPVVMLSRSNTTQHMYRYFVKLVELMREHILDLGLCTFCSCSIEEQRRLLQACPESPMYFTGSREVASRIKEVAPKLVASTGGPNTMLVGTGCFTSKVAQAVQMSNLIENKGQCTALRFLVLPQGKEEDIQAIYQNPAVSTSFEQSLRSKEFSALLRENSLPLAEGYTPLKVEGSKAGGQIAVRIGTMPPATIEEQWREAYLDVAMPESLDTKFLNELAKWLNAQQPISLALNCDMLTAQALFENTSLVVYTVGDAKAAPALTAQARPQDGECFGEFPPRRDMDAITSFPVIIPSSTPGYNTSYSTDFLKKHGSAPLEQWGFVGGIEGCKVLVRRCKSLEQKGYCRVLLDYIKDAANGPQRGCGSRTSLFGLQRPPLTGGITCLRLEKVSGANLPHVDALFDEAVRFILPFAATTAKEQLVISLDPFLSFPAFPMLAQQGLKVVRQAKEAFLAEKASYWNVVSLPQTSHSSKTSLQYPLAAHFMSKIFPMGHVKSTLTDHEEFVQAFTASSKWLRVRNSAPSTTTSKL